MPPPHQIIYPNAETAPHTQPSKRWGLAMIASVLAVLVSEIALAAAIATATTIAVLLAIPMVAAVAFAALWRAISSPL